MEKLRCNVVKQLFPHEKIHCNFKQWGFSLNYLFEREREENYVCVHVCVYVCVYACSPIHWFTPHKFTITRTGQAEVVRQELDPDLPNSCQESNYLGHQVYISKKLDSGAEASIELMQRDMGCMCYNQQVNHQGKHSPKH